MADFRELYEDAEAENTRLRTIVRWCAERLPATNLPTLQSMFYDAKSDALSMQALAIERRIPPGQRAKVEVLLIQIREFEPKHQILRNADARRSGTSEGRR